jgi:apolipoprotein N-acyltransferase
MLSRLAERHQVGLIFNNTTQGPSGRYYNSILYLRPDGSLGGRYDKIHLVPFGEFVPGADWLSFVHPLVQEVASFSAGSEVRVTDVGGVRVGGFICFEAVFPDLVRRFPSAGAELLVNITNDAWYGRTSAPAQHFQMARMRAIETRRFLVRAANSGISAVVDSNGRVRQQLGIFEQGAFIAGVLPLQGLTFYVRHGNWWGQVCTALFAAALLISRVLTSGLGWRRGLNHLKKERPS